MAMAPHPSPVQPAPSLITPPPLPPSTSRRVQKRKRPAPLPRQSIPDQAAIAQAEAQCFDDPVNSVYSCYPLSNTTIAQHQVLEFVWNSRLPWYSQTERVNITLHDGDTGDVIQTWGDVQNPNDRAGTLPVTVDDTFWGSRGTIFAGKNLSYPFYFQIGPNEPPEDAPDPAPQALFTAVQTTLADSVVASISSASAASASSASSLSSALAASSSSAAAASSAASQSSASATRPGSGSNPSASGPGGRTQSDAASGAFPHWAIAVIVVLGFLFLVAACLLFFLILRRIRNRRESSLSHRGSIGSSSPMMANAQDVAAQSPLLGGAALGAGGALAAEDRHGSSVVSPDGASTISRANSGSEGGLISGADAAIMADAFRKALRKPEFMGTPVEEGDTPESAGPESAGFDDNNGHQLMNQELAEEGRDLRNVGSSRDVHVEHSTE